MPASLGTGLTRSLWVDYTAAAPGRARRYTAGTLAVVGAALDNWWLAYLFVPGLLASPNAFFSAIEANGQPHAALLQHLDLAGGVLLVVALLLRGPAGRIGTRPEWFWVLVYAVSGAVGGIFPYACAEGLDPNCRVQEWSLQLPAYHYLHIMSGVIEFSAITWAAWLLRRRFRETAADSGRRRVFDGVIVAFAVMYPMLAVSYLSDRWGVFVEPLFFATFAFITLFEVFERP